VERADIDLIGGIAAQQLGGAFAHLACRLVGERDRADLARRKIAVAHQMRDLFGNHTRLAGAGAGQHQQRSIAVFDGGALLRIELHSDKCRKGRTL